MVVDPWSARREAQRPGADRRTGGAVDHHRVHLLPGLRIDQPRRSRVAELVGRVRGGGAREVVLALPATVDGQTTAHYLSDRLKDSGVEITSLARGVPVGGELDWLDDGTIVQALRARRPA